MFSHFFLWLKPTRFFLIMRVVSWAEPKIVFFPLHVCCGKESVYFQGATSVPNSAAMNKNGIVTEIHTKIRKEPFSAIYELVGKELGRWVVFVAYFEHIGGENPSADSLAVYPQGSEFATAQRINNRKSCKHFRFTLCTCLESALIGHLLCRILSREVAALGTGGARTANAL